MTDVSTAAPTVSGAPDRGLASRVAGIVFSPRETYAAVAERPRALGALLVTAIVMIACQIVFISTDVGREIMLDQQVRTLESFGVTVSDETYAQMEAGIDRALYTTPVSILAFIPIGNAITAGLVLVIFTMLLGGSATFKQAYAVAAHAGLIVAVQQLFATPLSYASGEMASATLDVFVPMLEETSFVTMLLAAIDLFYVWWIVSLAIGIGVLYRRRTGPIAVGLLSFYAVIALVIAAIRS